MLEEVYFEINKGTLTKEGEKILLQNIQILKDHPELKIRIAGFASVSGTDEYNQNLSERRANTVLAYILDKGYVSPERLDVIGYGETRPAIYEPIPSKIESKAAKSNMRVLFEVIVK
jgi:OOP family OmpA-OmpF porin